MAEETPVPTPNPQVASEREVGVFNVFRRLLREFLVAENLDTGVLRTDRTLILKFIAWAREHFTPAAPGDFKDPGTWEPHAKDWQLSAPYVQLAHELLHSETSLAYILVRWWPELSLSFSPPMVADVRQVAATFWVVTADGKSHPLVVGATTWQPDGPNAPPRRLQDKDVAGLWTMIYQNALEQLRLQGVDAILAAEPKV